MINKIKSLYDEFHRLTNTSQERRTEKWNQQKLTPFLDKLKICLDISCKDPVAIKKLEASHGVKMSPTEKEFLVDQLGPRKMFCTTEVERSWAKTEERKRLLEEGMQRLRENAELEKQLYQAKVKLTDEDCGGAEDVVPTTTMEEHGDFSVTQEEPGERGKKRKFEQSLAASTDAPWRD